MLPPTERSRIPSILSHVSLRSSMENIRHTHAVNGIPRSTRKSRSAASSILRDKFRKVRLFEDVFLRFRGPGVRDLTLGAS